ncbi:MAG: pyridoxamine 5'-phosphate oxidase [Saprospiraceae bacterium]|nr:pyridoxamine 5'-phosphate oxidase [Saprospiraceae bacterium]
MNRDISSLRENYSKDILDTSTVNANPFVQFKEWLYEALDEGLPEPTAFILSTVNQDGMPSGRTILLKEIWDDAFVFFTNYESHKAQDIMHNSHVAATFLWLGLERQIRIKANVKKVSREVTDAYFESRPRGSKLGAWASPQSQLISSREALDQRLKDVESQFDEVEDIPTPEFWGGYAMYPTEIEFWQGRRDRLHDRILYSKEKDNWLINRMAP